MDQNHVLSFEYNQIDSHIFIGTNLCCIAHFEKELLQKGITADISLEENILDSPFGVESYLWLPTPNNNIPTLSQLNLGVKVIDELIKQNRKIYIHCRFGHGRGPSLVAAYYIYKGLNVEESINKIKSQRPSVHLEETQLKGLHTFQNNLK